METTFLEPMIEHECLQQTESSYATLGDVSIASAAQYRVVPSSISDQIDLRTLNTAQWQADMGVILSSTDVLCTKGNVAKRHNEHFQLLCAKYIPTYFKAAAASQAGKKRGRGQEEVSLHVVREIQCEGGRFLKRKAGGGGWLEISDAQAMEQVSQCIRDIFRSTQEAASADKEFATTCRTDVPKSIAFAAEDDISCITPAFSKSPPRKKRCVAKAPRQLKNLPVPVTQDDSNSLTGDDETCVHVATDFTVDKTIFDNCSVVPNEQQAPTAQSTEESSNLFHSDLMFFMSEEQGQNDLINIPTDATVEEGFSPSIAFDEDFSPTEDCDQEIVTCITGEDSTCMQQTHDDDASVTGSVSIVDQPQSASNVELDVSMDDIMSLLDDKDPKDTLSLPKCTAPATDDVSFVTRGSFVQPPPALVATQANGPLVLTSLDVMFKGGQGPKTHNEHFTKLIEEHYTKLIEENGDEDSRINRKYIVSQVIRQVQAKGGRFLKPVPLPRCWAEVSPDESFKKVQAIVGRHLKSL
jgi:hypothetical protein